jgi:hypothetical protein
VLSTLWPAKVAGKLVNSSVDSAKLMPVPALAAAVELLMPLPVQAPSRSAVQHRRRADVAHQQPVQPARAARREPAGLVLHGRADVASPIRGT